MKPPERVCVVGAGRGSAELVDLLSDCHPDVDDFANSNIVVVDDRYRESGFACDVGAPVVGTLSDVQRFVDDGYRAISGIANSRSRGIRLIIVDKLGLVESAWTTVVHPRATVSRRAKVGRGVVIYPGVGIGVDAVVGDHAVVYYGAVVHHDSIVGRGAVLCAGVLLAGGVNIGEGAYLGIGAVVRDGVSVGKGAMVGMGAVVTRDVRDGDVVRGVPARV